MLWIVLPNKRNGTVRVANESGANRAEKAARQCPTPARADHDELGVFGLLDEGRQGGRRRQQFASDLYLRSVAERVPGDGRRVGEQAAALGVLLFRRFFEDGGLRPRRGGGTLHVHNGER